MIKMKSQREIREEKYPKLFNHLKTMQGITEEQREICLNDFYEMCEEYADIVDTDDLTFAFWWNETESGGDFWEEICELTEHPENKEQ